jgi:hypothetical protein
MLIEDRKAFAQGLAAAEIPALSLARLALVELKGNFCTTLDCIALLWATLNVNMMLLSLHVHTRYKFSAVAQIVDVTGISNSHTVLDGLTVAGYMTCLGTHKTVAHTRSSCFQISDTHRETATRSEQETTSVRPKLLIETDDLKICVLHRTRERNSPKATSRQA